MGIKWEIFSDRAKSLIQRWDDFNARNLKINRFDERCIEGFIAEIDDEFTKMLLEEAAKHE